MSQKSLRPLKLSHIFCGRLLTQGKMSISFLKNYLGIVAQSDKKWITHYTQPKHILVYTSMSD